jgi:drug/metabolite transporter (DMT)-like permease
MQRLGQTPLQTNAWAMTIGATLVAAWALVSGQPATFDPSPTYIGARLYLAIPGSVIGFTSYLTLVGRPGADRAAYCTVLFPVVALGNVAVFWRGSLPRLRSA